MSNISAEFFVLAERSLLTLGAPQFGPGTLL